MPLRLRLSALFALAAAIAIAGGGMIFLSQLRTSLYDTLDTGLRAQSGAAVQELTSDGRLPPFRPNDDPVLVERPDGLVIQASPAAAGLTLTPDQRRSARTGEVFFTTDVTGERTRVLAAAAQLPGDQVLVVTGTDTDISDDAIERVQAALLLGGPLAVLLVAVGAWLLADAAIRPVQRMRREAEEIGEYDTGRRLALPATRDEIAALGATMNGLLDRLHAALERERRFVADASHELRTPLAILRTELELAERPGRDPQALRTAISEAGQETDRLIRLTEGLLLLARADNHQPILRLEYVSLRELLARAVGHGPARDHRPAVDLDCPDDVRVHVDPDRLLQVVDNLLNNAIQHSPPGTPVRIVVRSDVQVTLDILDDGPGLPPEFQAHAFERFHRAEQDRSRESGGSGLGLSIVRAIVEAHGGTADIANRPEGGACATVRLPVDAASQLAHAVRG